MWWLGMCARLLAASGTTYANLIVVCCCCADVDLRVVVGILKKSRYMSPNDQVEDRDRAAPRRAATRLPMGRMQPGKWGSYMPTNRSYVGQVSGSSKRPAVTENRRVT